MTRDLRLNIRMGERERQLLQELADAEDQTISDFLRVLIRRLHVERFGSPKKPKPKK